MSQPAVALLWTPPTTSTKFHIDLDWWHDNHRDIRVYIRDVLCEECRPGYEDLQDVEEVDMVDANTGEVSRVDWLWYRLRQCCSGRPDYITPEMPIMDAVFRTLLANGNEALSVQELYERIDRRPPEVLLRMLVGGSVVLGIRPVH